MAYQSKSRVFMRFGCALAAVLFLAVASETSATVIRYNTSLGDVDVRLFNTATPNSVTNFLNYVTSNRYDGTFIHRVPQSGGSTQNFVVQGGGFKLNNSIFSAEGIITDAPIADEPGIANIRGALSFAKNSLGATSQWFFNIGDNSFLDAQDFTVFGRVLGDGMDVVDAINNLSSVNASPAENALGEDFDEIPVTDLNQVISQNDVTAAEAVMINDVQVLTNPDGDYNFDGTVNGADYTIWRDTEGSTTLLEADGNGNGVVDAADYLVWQNGFGSSISTATTVPEPTTIGLLLLGIACISGRQRR